MHLIIQFTMCGMKKGNSWGDCYCLTISREYILQKVVKYFFTIWYLNKKERKKKPELWNILRFNFLIYNINLIHITIHLQCCWANFGTITFIPDGSGIQLLQWGIYSINAYKVVHGYIVQYKWWLCKAVKYTLNSFMRGSQNQKMR